MEYILLHDTHDNCFKYTLLTKDLTQCIYWEATLSDLLAPSSKLVTTTGNLSYLFLNFTSAHIISTPIHLDELSYDEFASKYPELLL